MILFKAADEHGYVDPTNVSRILNITREQAMDPTSTRKTNDVTGQYLRNNILFTYAGDFLQGEGNNLRVIKIA